MFERHVCPICWALQDPDTGECLVCGEKYYILNVPLLPLPLSSEEKTDIKPCKYLLPFSNGFITFTSQPTMEIVRDNEVSLYGEIPISCNNHAQLTFEFIPEDKTDTLFQVYSGYSL